eukprot:EG_transcript_30697
MNFGAGGQEQRQAWDIHVLQRRLQQLEVEHERLMRERSAKISELTEKCDELRLELVMSSPLRSLSLDDLKAETVGNWNDAGEKEELRRQNATLQQEVLGLRQRNEQLAGDKAALIAALRRYGCPLPSGWSSHAESSSSSCCNGEHRTKCKCTATHKRCHRSGGASRGSRADPEASTFPPLSPDACTEHENLSTGSS